jgi:hypothetical protein
MLVNEMKYERAPATGLSTCCIHRHAYGTWIMRCRGGNAETGGGTPGSGDDRERAIAPPGVGGGAGEAPKR